MDNTMVRTAVDLEKKYNFQKLAKSAANIETNTNQIIHVQNELNDIKKTLIINLGDTLQSSVSLWFYEGEPTTSNHPYIDWNDPSEHINDFYYDQDSGYVYKYTENGWERQYDTNLISALALTNVELDVSTDHKRQVFLSQPTPPYQSGDWWIQDDGTLMICQIGKETGTYEENDFVVSSMYTATISTKQDDTIEILKGQIVTITEDYVKVQDLATGGATIINGDNITTGSINTDLIQGYGTLTTQVETNRTEIANVAATDYNNYQELLAKFDNVAGTDDITALQNIVNQIQTDTYTKTEIQQIVSGAAADGTEVSYVRTTSATFDENGMHYEKSGANTSSVVNETGIKVNDTSGSTSSELLFAGYDSTQQEALVRVANLYLTRYLGLSNWRIEQITDSTYGTGIGFFYLG